MKIISDIGIQIPQVYLPKSGVDLKKWAVIACDQFTAEPKGVVDVGFNLKVTQPRPQPPSSVLWLDKNGGFTPDNPNLAAGADYAEVAGLRGQARISRSDQLT